MDKIRLKFVFCIIFASPIKFYFPLRVKLKPAAAAIKRELLSGGYFDSVHFLHLLSFRQWLVPDLRHQARRKPFFAPHGDGLVQDFHLFPRKTYGIVAYKTNVVNLQRVEDSLKRKKVRQKPDF
jgi:hypothetical protein